jgi:type IV secretion system protein VirB1
MIGADFLIACAPNVAPETTQQIIQVESKGNPLAINVNGARVTLRPTDKGALLL